MKREARNARNARRRGLEGTIKGSVTDRYSRKKG